MGLTAGVEGRAKSCLDVWSSRVLRMAMARATVSSTRRENPNIGNLTIAALLIQRGKDNHREVTNSTLPISSVITKLRLTRPCRSNTSDQTARVSSRSSRLKRLGNSCPAASQISRSSIRVWKK